MREKTSSYSKLLLIVGPLPPPFGGSGLTVKSMLDELAGYPSVHFEVINTSPYTDPSKKMTGFKLEKIFRMVVILSKYLQQIFRADAILVFANPLFTFTIVPIMLLVARCFHKSFYIKPVGGDLDLFLESQHSFIRKYFLKILNSANGILAQTRLLQNILLQNGCSKTYYIPGFRSLPKYIFRKEETNDADLRLIFLGHISRDKGPLVLLEALQHISHNKTSPVTCDFFGLIHEDLKEEFLHLLQITPNARYCGVAEAGTGTQLITNYDVLILPTFFKCEGHPGVIIEAMHAGVPVISTHHRSIPELITNGVNGILVPTNDSHALAEAIQWAADNRPELRKMGQENWFKGQEFSSKVVVSQMMEIIF